MARRDWVAQLPTVEECDSQLARLSRLIAENIEDCHGDPRETVRLCDLRRSWRTKRIWAHRFGKTSLPW